MSGRKKQLERAERELAQIRSLVRGALGHLGTRPDADDGYDDDSEYAAGYRAAVEIVRGALIPKGRPSDRQVMLDQTAVCVGLEPGGRCTGHLGHLWDAAYEEGARNALTAGPLL